MFRIEFLLNPENQSLENKSSVGSKRKEKEVGKKEIGISSGWLAFCYYYFSVYLKQDDLSATLQVKKS